MKVYFARHGEYQNPEGVVPYRMPGFPLTELGISQSGLQAEKLLSLNIRDIFSSPIERCVQTASIIGSSLHLAVNQSESLTEIGSPLEGVSIVKRDSYTGNFPYDVAEHIEGGGETKQVVVERMAEFVGKLKLMSKNSSHLLVSHGDPIKYYLSHVTKKDIPLIPMGGLVCLDYNQVGIPKYTEII